MAAVNNDNLREIAAACVSLVHEQFGQQLDRSLQSLDTADSICAELLADGPMATARFDLWLKLIGAYTGEVLIRAYDGKWIIHDGSGDVAVKVEGMTVFPFSTTRRLLQGEWKSLASLDRAIPAVRENAPKHEGSSSAEQPNA